MLTTTLSTVTGTNTGTGNNSGTRRNGGTRPQVPVLVPGQWWMLYAVIGTGTVGTGTVQLDLLLFLESLFTTVSCI